MCCIYRSWLKSQPFLKWEACLLRSSTTTTGDGVCLELSLCDGYLVHTTGNTLSFIQQTKSNQDMALQKIIYYTSQKWIVSLILGLWFHNQVFCEKSSCYSAAVPLVTRIRSQIRTTYSMTAFLSSLRDRHTETSLNGLRLNALPDLTAIVF